MYKSNTNFNYARKSAFEALSYCLEKYYNVRGMTEKSFSEIWISELSQNSDIVVDGWYSPPPMGIAVLSGGVVHPCRISYDSLRNPEFWPQEREINWKDDLFYVYYSPLSIRGNMPGDTSLTLYFGKDKGIRDHFKTTHAVTNKILSFVEECSYSNELFSFYLKTIDENDLRGCGLSSTDPSLTNLGHTLPHIDLEGCKNISESQRKEISVSRKFINGNTNWAFDNEIQFTVEPQLMSMSNPELPQISYHYLACKKAGQIYICDDINALLGKYDLI